MTHKNTTHGLSKTPIYMAWVLMRHRCKSPSSQAYEKYGGRGVKLCARWEKIENFLEDMGQPPKGLTIDRIDNDGDYTPNNCRWATASQQQQNKGMSKTNKSGIKGVSWSTARKKWCVFIMASSKQIFLGRYDDLTNAAAARKAGEARYW